MSTVNQVQPQTKEGTPASISKTKSRSIASSIKGIKKRKEEKNKSIKGSVVFSTKIRAIGNSKGVIINNQLMEAAGIHADVDLIMYAKEGKIILMEAPKEGVNTNLATWDKHFKAAIKKGATPDTDLFEGLDNNFDKNEW